jgi:D-ribose pyranase
MLAKGILNPQINSLLSRVRHTNYLVISDRGFPFWPQIETIDISLCDDIPQVLQVFEAIQQNFNIGEVIMAREFQINNSDKIKSKFSDTLRKHKVTLEKHVDFKRRVPSAIGLIRTGDTTQYANMILVSA